MKFSTFSYDPQISLKHNSFVLTCDEMKYQRFKKHFSDNNIPQPFKVWNKGKTYDANGCLNGHNKILKLAKKLNLPYCTIFEDDAYPRVDCFNRLEKIYFPNLLNNFDILFLGWNRIEESFPNCMLDIGSKLFHRFKISNHKITKNPIPVCYGSHAYIVRHHAFDRITSINTTADDRLSDESFNTQHILENYFCQRIFNDDKYLYQLHFCNFNQHYSFVTGHYLITDYNKGSARVWSHHLHRGIPRYFR